MSRGASEPRVDRRISLAFTENTRICARTGRDSPHFIHVLHTSMEVPGATEFTVPSCARPACGCGRSGYPRMRIRVPRTRVELVQILISRRRTALACRVGRGVESGLSACVVPFRAPFPHGHCATARVPPRAQRGNAQSIDIGHFYCTAIPDPSSQHGMRALPRDALGCPCDCAFANRARLKLSALRLNGRRRGFT